MAGSRGLARMSPEMRKLISARGAAAQAARGKRFKYDSDTAKAARQKQQEEKAQSGRPD